MLDASHTLLAAFGLLVAAMTGLWLLSLALRDASLVDPFWGVGFALVAWTAGELRASLAGRPLLLAVLTTIWGLRLSCYLLWRNWRRGEDDRYRAMREHHGSRFAWVSFFTVFLLQAVLLWLVSLPVQSAAILDAPDSWGVLDAMGLILWCVGMFYETVGDWQLARFRSDPRSAGRVLDRGLWRYTRHPNYFGDFCVWWGLYLIAASGGAWWTIGSPLLMSTLLLKVSGVTLLERTIAERRPEYAAYRARTNAFFPGRPR